VYNPHANKTSGDVYQLLDSIHDQLERAEQVELAWRRTIETKLQRIEQSIRNTTPRSPASSSESDCRVDAVASDRHALWPPETTPKD